MRRPLAPRPAWAPVALSLGLTACGSTDPTDPDSAHDAGTDWSGAPDTVGSPSVVLGTGFTAYTPLAPRQEIPIIQGIQGGYHVWGAFSAAGLDPRGLQIDFRLDVGGATIAAAHYVDSPPSDGGRIDYAGVAVILAPEYDPDTVSGSVATLGVSLVDASGRTVTDSVEIIPICCTL